MSEERTQLETTDVANKLRIESREEKAVALGESHYQRIQRKIRGSVGLTSASLWLAAAFTFLGAALGGWITVASIPVQNTASVEAARGKVWVALAACVVLTIVCAIGHIGWYRNQRRAGDDICDEMDTYSRGKVN